MLADHSLTREQATVAALERHPELYQRYREAQKGRL
jgi:hypothetical protein